MFKIGEKVYYTLDNIIKDGFVVGRQTSEVNNKVPQTLYLVNEKEDSKRNIPPREHFSGDLQDFLIFPDTALFESLEALQKRQQELYLWSKGTKSQPFI